MKIDNLILMRALNAKTDKPVTNAKGSIFYNLYSQRAIAAVREIEYEAEGCLRVLSGYGSRLAENAKSQGDLKGAEDIERCQKILQDALTNYIRISKRTIG